MVIHLSARVVEVLRSDGGETSPLSCVITSIGMWEASRSGDETRFVLPVAGSGSTVAGARLKLGRPELFRRVTFSESPGDGPGWKADRMVDVPRANSGVSLVSELLKSSELGPRNRERFL